MVRQDVALGRVDDDAGASGFDFVLAFLRCVRCVEIEEAFEELVIGERIAPSVTLPLTEMFTTAGEIFSIIGARLGISRVAGCADAVAAASDAASTTIKREPTNGDCRSND